MRYQRPVLINLQGPARYADGQGPMACVSGPSAGNDVQSCATGTGALLACGSGIGGASPDYLCAAGGTAGGDCLVGSWAGGYCESGGGGANDPFGCVSGPVPD